MNEMLVGYNDDCNNIFEENLSLKPGHAARFVAGRIDSLEEQDAKSLVSVVVKDG